MKTTIDGVALVYAEGAFNTLIGKTAHGLIRFTLRYDIAGVIDSRYAGQDAGMVLDHKPYGIPVFRDLPEALDHIDEKRRPKTLIIGLAPDGGRLPHSAKSTLKLALQMGMNIDSGLHDYISNDDELMPIARQNNCRVRDIRKTPEVKNLHFFSGKIEAVNCLKVAVLGADSAIGKRTTAWIMIHAFRQAGYKAELIGTGQTAWLQGAKYTTIMDSCINDFVSGEIEHVVYKAWKNETPDLLVIEGQGSLMNPAYPGGFEILAAARPDYVIFQHAPKRLEYDGFPGYRLHSLEEQIRAIETISPVKVLAVTINHEGMTTDEIPVACRTITEQTGLPAFDVLAFGANELVELLKKVSEMKTPEDFVVLKRLLVSNIHIEPKRVKATYCIEQFSGESDCTDLFYSYEQRYFDKNSVADINLASVMLAQVALNYGLFFETIELDGFYNQTDRTFIAAMLENTSREILTNKLLVNNEFIKAPYHEVSIVKKRRYTNARLVFSNTSFSGLTLASASEKSDSDKYAILSSGGKDSLLSYGLIQEIGTPYPVFINESGRHWYTAVNAYRYLKTVEPNTIKPWCNSDRVFNKILKLLPFIKENYASIRSDIYPIRLWTLSVFLFGVLPVALKKGIGNILIGDEFDTTHTGTLKGIKHYHGLYDQSKYFDKALTRYYRQKGWDINQFSLLRSLSELLIMKVLIMRYPHLQEHQISCHAAHEKNGRMYPCGKCEKCRRIIGMIVALGMNPESCGYNPQQIAEGLKALESKSVKQISSDAAHLYFMLCSERKIGNTAFTGKIAKEHPEIMKLRIDPQRSDPMELPEYIRKPLYDILNLYSDGVVKKAGRQWIDIRLEDLLPNEAKRALKHVYETKK